MVAQDFATPPLSENFKVSISRHMNAGGSGQKYLIARSAGEVAVYFGLDPDAIRMPATGTNYLDPRAFARQNRSNNLVH